jgi:hypothetical protein
MAARMDRSSREYLSLFLSPPVSPNAIRDMDRGMAKPRVKKG